MRDVAPTESSARQRQFVAYAVMALAAVASTGVLSLSHTGASQFEPYFGIVPALLAVVVTALAGWPSLTFLQAGGWFAIYIGSRRGIGLAATIATLFAAWQIGADLFVTRFPEDINVPFPHSLLFYPAIGYVVEVVLHALPLALLLALLRQATTTASSATVIWLCMVVVASLEPLLVHMRLGASAYVGAFVFVFTLVELCLCRRFDFVSMLACRLVYYAWWHIAWGHVRLRWLF